MTYVKQTWVDGDTTKPVSAARMQHIEDGLDAVANGGSIPADKIISQARKDERSFPTIGSGSWCWFNGPTVLDYENVRYLGWIDTAGSVIVASVDLETGAVQTFDLHLNFTYANNSNANLPNDHSSPGLVVRPDGRLIAFYAQQGSSAIYYRITTNPGDVTSWQAEQTVPTSSTGSNATYPRPHYIGSRLFLFYTSSPEQRITWSDDNGATWSSSVLWQTFYPYGGGYLQMRDNGSPGTPGNRIDWILSEHPNDSTSSEPAMSSMYHGYFDGTTFYATGGTVITTLAALPVLSDPTSDAHARTGTVLYTSMTKVYDYTTNGLCWAWDLAYDSAGHPVCVFSSYPNAAIGDTATSAPSHFKDHRYNYYRWNGSAWSGAQIVAGGQWINDDPSFYIEDQYSGGIALLPSDPTVVYLSRQVGPSLQWEIERWVTTDGYGASWISSAVTVESPANTRQIRPLTPYGHTAGSSEVVFLSGLYHNYTSFATSIAIGPKSPMAQVAAGFTSRPTATDVLLQPALAVSPTILLPLSSHLGDISGNKHMTTTLNAPVFGQGRYGKLQAASFDGTTDRAIKTDINFAKTSVYTVFGWAYRTNHSANHTLFGSYASTFANYCLLRINSGGQDIVWTADSSVAAITWAAACPGDVQWFHWALIFDHTGTGTAELYINGVSKGQQAATADFHDTSQFFKVGSYATNAYPFNGQMAIVGLVQSALSATQIATLAGAVSGSKGSNAALASVIAQLVAMGILGSDHTT